MFRIRGILLSFSLLVQNPASACLSITDDLNFLNPSLNATFDLEPDVNPYTNCWQAAFRIRSNEKNWRLIGNRTGPKAIGVKGAQKDNVMASDITLNFTLKNLGKAKQNGAFLVSPFTSETNLSSIQYGTFIISGIEKTGNTCSLSNPNFYQLIKKLCLFHDFIFNIGQYNGEVSYILVAP